MLDKALAMLIKEIAKEAREIGNADTCCSDSFTYAGMFADLIEGLPGITSVELVEGTYTLDREYCTFKDDSWNTVLTKEHEHSWVVVNGDIIVDIGSDLYEFPWLMDVKNKRVELWKRGHWRYREIKSNRVA